MLELLLVNSNAYILRLKAILEKWSEYAKPSFGGGITVTLFSFEFLVGGGMIFRLSIFDTQVLLILFLIIIFLMFSINTRART
jgi:hypothetical protein